MVLNRTYVDINGVEFDSRSYIENHILHVCKTDLAQVAADPSFSSMDFDIAAPGTKCRITNMGDIVQPAVKTDNGAATFPGIVDKVGVVGSGNTLMLRGMAVSETSEVPIQLPCMLDTSEEAAEYTDFATIFHLVIDAFPAENTTREEYLDALHKASKRIAKYVAGLAIGLEPDDSEVFSLERDGLEGLPRVAYLADVFCHAPFQETTVYGGSMIASMPTILHPNEVLDGAVSNKDYDSAVNADPTYVWQNHPIILDLYRRHGVDLNFVGVVVNNVHHIVDVKQRNASMAATLLAKQLKADGVIITKEGGGHPQVDVGFAADILEEKYGVKTSILLAEFLSPNNDAYGQLLIQSKNANAIVSTGCFAVAQLPAVDKVIGHIPPLTAEMKPAKDMAAALTVNNRALHGCESQLGWTRYGSQKF